jgi:predicted alpha/beta hydrolase family esterase
MVLAFIMCLVSGVNGNNDPWCPLEGAQTLSQETDGELVAVPGGGHFSTSLDARFTKFPELVKILEERDLL